jgi:hypothetical protein
LKVDVEAKKQAQKSKQIGFVKWIGKNKFPIVFSIALSVAAIITIFVFSKYFFSFEDGLPLDRDKWGVFGDYIGGVLNPLLAFLSFIALLFTISLQSKELKISNETLMETKSELEQSRKIAQTQVDFYKSESNKNDLLRTIDAVHSEIKELFEKPVDFCSVKSDMGCIIERHNMGWFFSNSAPRASASLIPKNGDTVSQNDRILLADLCEYMMEISTYLHEYVTKFGASSTSYYYQQRYLTAKKRLVDNGFLIDMALKGFQQPGYGWSA